MLSLLAPSLALAETVRDQPGRSVRSAPAAGPWSDILPPPAESQSGGAFPRMVLRSSSADGVAIDPAGVMQGRQQATRVLGLSRATGLANATIDSIHFGDSEDSYPDRPSIYMLGRAQTYYLSDGTSWNGGAGTYYVNRASFDHAEVAGNKVRYYFHPPAAHLLYQQTDFNAGEHSSQGRLDCGDPLLLEATLGSTVAVLRGNATIVSNEPTFYPSFNYFGAPVGAIVPFQIVYELTSGGTWTADSFESPISYREEGRVWFGRAPFDAPLAELRITGPAEIAGVSSFRYRAIARHQDGVLSEVSDAAAWSVAPSSLAGVDGGLLTTLPLAAAEATLTLRAQVGGLSAERSIRYLQGPPADVGTDWPMYQANSRHTGFRPVDLNAANFAFKWQRDFPTSFGLNPVTASDGRVFCSVVTYFSVDAALRGLDARTGQTLWTKPFPGVFSINPPSVGLGKVFVQSGNHGGDTWLHALDPASGATIFQSRHGAQWERYFAPTIYEGKVYIDGGGYGGMYAFDGTSGSELWYASLPQYDQWTPAVDEQFAYAYVGEYNPGLYVLRRDTGVIDHFVPDVEFQWNGWSMNLAPVLGDASDVLAIHNGRLINFDLAGEEIRWQARESFVGQPSVEGGSIYAIKGGGRLSVRDEVTGSELWSWTPPGLGLTSNIVLTRTHAFVSSPDRVYAIDRVSHAEAWSYAAGGHLALADGMLFVSSPQSGRLTAFEVAPPAVLAANAGADIAVECASADGAGTSVRLDGSGSTGAGITYAWSAPGITFDDPASATPTGRFPLGATEVTLVVAAGGQTASDKVEVRVADTQAPSIVVTTDTPVLWPPDHQLVPVHFSVLAADACDGSPSVRLLSVTSSEPDAGTSLDDVVFDVQNATTGSADFDVVLRAERGGNGLGRTYSICFEAEDETGNRSTGCAEVVVPHDRRGEGRLAANAFGWTATLFGSPVFAAGTLDASSVRIVRPGAVPQRWDGTPVGLSDVNHDQRDDATLSLLPLSGGPMIEPVLAIWNAPDGMCATPLALAATTAVGDGRELAFATAPLRNPGLGSASIRYVLPAPGHVRLSVWDVSGRLVRRLVDRAEAAGPHQVEFAPGERGGTRLYFYRVEWEGVSRTGKFTILG